MLAIACLRKSSDRARQYVKAGPTELPRSTMNSVEPLPTCASSRHWTYPVLPFSRHGVIRANRVSPFTNLAPESPAFRSLGRTIMLRSLRSAMVTNGCASDLSSLIRGLMIEPIRRFYCRPALRDLSNRRIHLARILVTGVAEMHKPLAVDRPSHLLQHLNSPPVVLNQVVYGSEDRADSVLDWSRRQCDGHAVDALRGRVSHGRSGCGRSELAARRVGQQQVVRFSQQG